MLSSDTLRRRVRERLAEQRALVATLLQLRQQLQGSLFVRYGQCGKEHCVCRQGRGHGPYYVLSGGAGSFTYVEGADVPRVRRLVDRYRAFRRGFRQLRRLNEELVELLKRYQATSAREGGRGLRLGPVRGQKRAHS